MTRLVAIAVLTTAGVLPQLTAAPFVPRMLNRDGKFMPYRLFIPHTAAQTEPLPLIVWLHGASGLGTDNVRQVTEGGNEIGSRLWIKADIQAKYPSFVVAPQSPSAEMWGTTTSERLTKYGQLVIDLIDSLAKEFPIDRDRIYLLGQSRGGIGVWDLIAKRPDVFAAAVPLCAIGNPKKIGAASDVKVWAFHGAKDPGMSVNNTREMVAALKAAGGVVKYTEYADLGHDIWARAFAEPDLPAWLFAQRRNPGDCQGQCY